MADPGQQVAVGIAEDARPAAQGRGQPALNPPLPEHVRAAVMVDHSAIAHNIATITELAGSSMVMAVVKADGYGHGAPQLAATALANGAQFIGVTLLDEAVQLREAGITAPILFWLCAPAERYEVALEHRIDIGVSSLAALEQVRASAERAERIARVHLKVDTGLSRNGASDAEWPELVTRAKAASRAGQVDIVGIWSHLACADLPGHPSVPAQLRRFDAALAEAARAGVEAPLRHLANSAGLLFHPDSHFDMVRCGIAAVGLSPNARTASAATLGLRPAMTLTARLAHVKDVPAGTGVSYGHSYLTPTPTRLGLVPLGYADGVPVSASNTMRVQVGGALRPVVGRVTMDQFVIDLEGAPAQLGDEVVLFGPGLHGEPTVTDWATALGTINYEIVTRITSRVPRHHYRSQP